jgi:hypothetical protein
MTRQNRVEDERWLAFVYELLGRLLRLHLAGEVHVQLALEAFVWWRLSSSFNRLSPCYE